MPDSYDVNLTKRYVKEHLQRDYVKFRGHEDKKQFIYDLLLRTAEQGESNSVLLIGSRGTGKTTLISSVVYDLLSVPEFTENSKIVHLNGLIHTDDRQALKSVTVQLCLENAVNGKVFGSFAENLDFLLACLKSGGKKKSKSIVFILEEFDIFSAHHNQTLLYNLFDVSQSAQAPICVVGITCRLDVIELLEKRVKSRFSHRQILLMSHNENIDKRLQLFKELLQLPTDTEIEELKKKSIPNISFLENTEMRSFRNLFNPLKYEFNSKHVEQWNKSIEKLTNSTEVKCCLQELYAFDKNEASLKKFLYQLIGQISADHPNILVEDVTKLAATTEDDEKLQLLLGLSVLELSLIIAIKHHSEIYDRDPFNFEIIYSRFMKFAKTSSTMQGIERAVVLKAFEHLRNLEFLMPLKSTVSKVKKEFQMHKFMLMNNQINKAILKYQALPTDVSQWAQNSFT